METAINLSRVLRLASPLKTGLVLLCSDFLTLGAACLLSVYLRYLYDHSLLWDIYLNLWPVLILFPAAYAFAGLYPGVGINPPEELRRITYSSLLVFAVVGASTFMYRSGTKYSDYSRGVFVFAVVLVPVLIPLGRALMRELFARKAWWGVNVLIFGAAQTGRDVVHTLHKHVGLGLKPIALLDDDPQKQGQLYDGLLVIGGLEEAPKLARAYNISHAVLAMPGLSRDRLLRVFEEYSSVFPHLILIPNLFGLGSLWVSAKDYGGVLALEVKQRLLMPGPRLVKRLLDIGLIAVCALPALLLIGLIALIVKLDSRGTIFYWQERLGVGGKRFKVAKFRTMYGDGEQRLSELLSENPALRLEYERYHKLKDDPRVTRVGRVLRKLSLDELPQVWNVFRGEMSLVGPRAYLPREQEKMGEATSIILKVLPGITGFWQVNGRNALTFGERNKLDIYYVRNWSVWLDLHILARTVWVILFARGAY